MARRRSVTKVVPLRIGVYPPLRYSVGGAAANGVTPFADNTGVTPFRIIVPGIAVTGVVPSVVKGDTPLRL